MANLELAFSARVPNAGRVEQHQEVAELAFEFWLERGFQDGSPEEDLLRAHQVIAAKRKSAAPLRQTSRLFLVKGFK